MFSAVATTRAMLGILGSFKWFNNAAFMGAAPKPVRWQMDFAGRKVLWFVISGVVVLISLGSLAVNGLNEGIDFEGGTRINVTLEQPASAGRRARRAVVGSTPSLGDAVIRGRGTTAGQNSFTEFQVDAKEFPTDDVAAFTQGLRERYGVADQPDVRSVSASFGSEILRGAILAFIFSMFLIVVYIAFRFDWRYAVPMIVALIHDLIITVGVYSIFDREVSSATVAAVLTVLGYSLYDTIIIFDRVRENEAHAAQAHLRRDREHLAVGDADALAEHVVHHAPADPLAVHLRRRDAAGLRLRAAHRHRLRRVLVVLHRRAAAGVLKGREPEFKRRTGSNELPSFLLRETPKTAPVAEPVAAGRGAKTATVAAPSAVAEAERPPPPDVDAAPAAAPAEPVDDAEAQARAAARARRADRKTRRRPHGR